MLDGIAVNVLVNEATEVQCSDWREIDRTLVGQARQRAALDAEEARWLRAAARVRIWREFGFVSMVDYMERRLGYGVRSAQDRLRVACALDELPSTTQALENGEIPFTGVRVLAKVATPENEQTWLDACEGKSVREIEELVSGHEKGDLPFDPKKPDLELRVLRYTEIRPSTAALEREALAKARAELGGFLTNDQFLAMVFGAFVESRGANDESGRAKYQVAITVCAQCDQGWRDSAGKQVAVDAADVARARCDAQHIGSLDSNAPERAKQDIPPRTVRFVRRRDHGKCGVPGCRSAMNLEIHHIVARADGGTHDPENLTLLCGSCHDALHRGLITITGKAPGQLIVTRRRDSDAHVCAPTSVDRATLDVQAKSALVNLGYSRPVAAAAITAARAHVCADVEVELLIHEALRHCPRPKGAP